MNATTILPATPTAPAIHALAPSDHERVKQEILSLYGVVPTEQFDPAAATRARIDYLKAQLRSTKRRGFVLGISGGVDSTTAGRLAQLACAELRAEGYDATFYAVRLPAGFQRDEADAQAALAFIAPDQTLTINVGPAANALNDACLGAVSTNGRTLSASEADYHKGNIKARLRMAAQYHLAAVYGGLVLGTDHYGEKIPAFWTKFADEACDLIVLNGLSKRHVRLCAKFLGAPEVLWDKPPTADLEELNPGKLDDEGFGFPYSALDDFLEGKDIDQLHEAKIIARYDATRYRRAPIVEFSGS